MFENVSPNIKKSKVFLLFAPSYIVSHRCVEEHHSVSNGNFFPEKKYKLFKVFEFEMRYLHLVDPSKKNPHKKVEACIFPALM